MTENELLSVSEVTKAVESLLALSLAGSTDYHGTVNCVCVRTLHTTYCVLRG